MKEATVAKLKAFGEKALKVMKWLLTKRKIIIAIIALFVTGLNIDQATQFLDLIYALFFAL